MHFYRCIFKCFCMYIKMILIAYFHVLFYLCLLYYCAPILRLFANALFLLLFAQSFSFMCFDILLCFFSDIFFYYSSQINVHSLNKALENGGRMYTAVLFYAEWCPFSITLRETFESLAMSFPTISHLAIESSSLWPR